MSLHPLYSDMLLWTMAAIVSFRWWRTRKDPRARRMWRRIFADRGAMVAAVLLGFYLAIAMVDSIRFERADGARIESLLDMAMRHRTVSSERTYSAPFATHEFVKSLVTEGNGTVAQRYLPLKEVHTDRWYADGWHVAFVVFASMFALTLLHRRLRKDDDTADRLPWGSAYAAFVLAGGTLVWLYVMSFSYHVLGTDKVGVDLFYVTLKSIRTGVLIGTLTTLVTLPLALVLGIAAGYFRGWIDDAVQYLYTVLSSIPGVLLIAAGVLTMQVMLETHADLFATSLERADVRLLFLIVILGVTSWTGLCRILRAETLRLSQSDFVTAAKTLGSSHTFIMFKHILPNLRHLILISVVLDFSGLVLAEAVLSYVGVGVDPTTYSWGNMINQARLEMARDPMVWWSLFAAFVFMFFLVLAANMLSDRVQYVLDPRNEA